MSDKLATVKKISDMLNEGLTKEEFVKSFKNVAAIVLKTQKKLADDNSQMRADFEVFTQRVKADKVSDLEEIRTEARVVVGNAINTLTESMNKKLASMQSSIDLMNNSREPDQEAMMTRVQALIPTITELANQMPVLGPQVRDALELLQGDARLDYTAIRGLENAITAAAKANMPISGQKPGGRTGMYYYINGVKKGIISNVNFVAGTNMAIAYSKVNGQDTFTFNASGGGTGGVSVETPPEACDGMNQVFTVSKQPKWVVADGTTYYEGAGYSYSSGTGKITMDLAPSTFIRDIISTT